jgi:hypothetical protein
MAEPVLDRPGVDPIVGQLVAAGLPQYVEMHWEWQACALADDLDLPIDGIRREGRAALSREDVAAMGYSLRSAVNMRSSSPLIGWIHALPLGQKTKSLARNRKTAFRFCSSSNYVAQGGEMRTLEPISKLLMSGDRL